MPRLNISLFGRMHIESDGTQLADGFETRKVQELLSYLLLYRKQPHPRETLADVLWGEASGTQSRKYLRQALWQLQSSLKEQTSTEGEDFLCTDSDWVGIGDKAELWSDVGQFEACYDLIQGKPAESLTSDLIQQLTTAVELYRGGLLPGWYQDWCIYERERFESMYLSMLNKLMLYYEYVSEYELGLVFGHRILQFDRAHERTHWRMMRLHYFAGDRTGALRQYERCAKALEEELEVAPAEWTRALHDQIREGNLSIHSSQEVGPSLVDTATDESLSLDAPAYLHRLQSLLVECRAELQKYMQSTELESSK